MMLLAEVEVATRIADVVGVVETEALLLLSEGVIGPADCGV